MSKVWNIEVVDKTCSHDHGDGDNSGEPYSYRGTSSTHHTIKGFKVSQNEKSYRDFPVDFEPQYGVAYYLLYAIYTTGDSFRSLKEEKSPVSFSPYTRRPRSLRRCDPSPR